MIKDVREKELKHWHIQSIQSCAHTKKKKKKVKFYGTL